MAGNDGIAILSAPFVFLVVVGGVLLWTSCPLANHNLNQRLPQNVTRFSFTYLYMYALHAIDCLRATTQLRNVCPFSRRTLGRIDANIWATTGSRANTMRLSAAYGCRWYGIHTRWIEVDATKSARTVLSSADALGKLLILPSHYTSHRRCISLTSTRPAPSRQ